MSLPPVNIIIEWLYDENPRAERVLGYSSNGYVACMDMNSKSTVPRVRETKDVEDALETGYVRPALSDPHLGKNLPEESIPEKHKSTRDKGWALIAGIVGSGNEILFDVKLRRKLILKSARENSKKEKVIIDKLVKYWKGGQTRNALLPNFRNFVVEKEEGRGKDSSKVKTTGRVPRVAITDYVRQRFEKAIGMYESSERITFQKAYEMMIERFFSSGTIEIRGKVVPKILPVDQLPTVYQFRYYYKKTKDPKVSLLSREGRKYYLKHREILGDSMDLAFGPGSCYQIDSTPCDVELVSFFDANRLIGRPFLYLVVDVYTRCIVGFHVSLENPSYAQACIAIENAISEKVEVCKRYGVSIEPHEWPCHGVPESLLADRGELVGEMPDAITTGLNIRLDNTPPYRADMKGIVERFFGMLNERLIKSLPGAVDKDSNSRGAPDPRLGARINLIKFSELVVEYVLFHNRLLMKNYRPDLAQMQSSVESRPLSIWAWGIENRGGPLRHIDRGVAKLLLLPKGNASITQRGIRFQGLHYTCARAVEERWFITARRMGATKVEVSYDPRDVSRIYLRSKGGLEECELTKPDSRYNGAAQEDREDYNAVKRDQQESDRSDEIQDKVAFNAMADGVAKEAEKGHPKTKISKSKLKKDIRGNRKNESALLDGSGTFSNDAVGEFPPSADEEYIPPKSHASILRRRSNPEK